MASKEEVYSVNRIVLDSEKENLAHYLNLKYNKYNERNNFSFEQQIHFELELEVRKALRNLKVPAIVKKFKHEENIFFSNEKRRGITYHCRALVLVPTDGLSVHKLPPTERENFCRIHYYEYPYCDY